MSTQDNDPLSAFSGALASVLGCALLILTTSLCGLWLGLSYKQGLIAPLQDALILLVLSTFLWLVYPGLAIAVAVSVLAWYISLRSESAKVRIGTASANFAVWLAAGAWAT